MEERLGLRRVREFRSPKVINNKVLISEGPLVIVYLLFYRCVQEEFVINQSFFNFLVALILAPRTFLTLERSLRTSIHSRALTACIKQEKAISISYLHSTPDHHLHKALYPLYTQPLDLPHIERSPH